MTPLQIVDRYEEAVFLSGQVDRFFLARKCVGTFATDAEARALAREALWLAIKENPKTPVSVVLRKAKKLYSRFLREDFLPTMAQIVFKKRNDKLHYFDTVTDFLPEPETPDHKIELESEVYNCLDLVIRRWGVHLGLWAILAFALGDTQTKGQTIYRYMGLKPTRQQEKAASLIIQKLKALL